MWLELFLLFVLLAAYFIMKDRKPKNMPPGPMEIPFLGNMPILHWEQAEKLRQNYGDIVTVRTGNMRSVLIFDYNLGKEVMARAEMAGRPEFFKKFSIYPEEEGGLLGSTGAHWQHDRRFSLRNLRNLGMGKSDLEEAIHIEAQALVDDLKKHNEKPIPFPDAFRTCALNIIWQMVSSHRYEYDSEEIDKIYELTKRFQNQPLYTLIPFFFPSMGKYFPKIIMDGVFKDHFMKEFLGEIKKTLKKSVDEHEDDLDNPCDFIDEYKKEMRERSEEGNNKFCSKEGLMQIINDLFGAGSDTVNNMLKWMAFLLATCPEQTKKLRDEIDEYVPRSRMVSLEDKPNLPYVEAYINEALRYSSMIVMNVQRTALRDTSIGGYFIPKDMMVVVSNYSCHYDTKYWKEPEKFMPERFLDEDGKFRAPKDGFFAFGQGRRQCLGELLARMELFLFTASIAQNFDILVPEGVEYEMKFDNKLGLRVPFDKTLIYKPREVK